jgi:SAM-dependent methyltransferase
MKTELLQQCSICGSPRLDVIDSKCNIVKCLNCGLVFDNPRPAFEELVNFYSQPTKYDSWLQELGAREHVWKRRLKILERHKKSGSLLDVGTGIGQFLSVASSSFSAAFGTEVSSTAVEIAKTKYKQNLFQGTVEELSEQGSQFDNITLFHVLEHVPNPKKTIEVCRSLLSEGGILAIAVPNEIGSLRAYIRKVWIRMGMKTADGLGRLGLPLITLDPSTPEIHLSHFTVGVLERLLESTGFTVVKSTLDPFSLKTGLASLKSQIYYYGSLAFLHLLKVNLYDTIFVLARKDEHHLENPGR